MNKHRTENNKECQQTILSMLKKVKKGNVFVDIPYDTFHDSQLNTYIVYRILKVTFIHDRRND